MNINPVNGSATPPPEFSRMVYGQFEPEVQLSTVQSEEPPVGLSRMIPGESSSPEPQIMAFNDQVDSIQNALSQTRITPATYIPTNFADWPDIEPEPIIDPITIHSSRSMNDLLPTTTNPLHIPENERETDVEGANIQDHVAPSTNQRDNSQYFKQSINHRNDEKNSRPSRRNHERENTATEADISNDTDNESNRSDSNTSDSAVPTTTNRKYRNSSSNNEKDHRKSKHSRNNTYYESGKLKSDRSYDYGASGGGSRHYRSRQSSISDMYTEGYTSDYHRGYSRKHENDPREKRHRRKKDVEKDYYNTIPHNYYYGNMSHDMAMFNPFLSNYYQQYTIQYQNWLMHQQKLAKSGVINTTKPQIDPYYTNTNIKDRSQVHSGRSSVSEFEKHDLMMGQQTNVLSNIDENDYSEMYSFTKQNRHDCEERSTPMKFSIKHSKVNFSTGNLIICNSSNSYDNRLCSPSVSIINVKDLLENDTFQSELEDFPGPLIKGVVHKSTVIEYCEEKIRNAHLRKDLGDVDSYILIWEFLVLIIRQNGIMEGADISDLLMRNDCFDTLKSHSSKDSKSDKSDKQKRPITKEESIDRYRDLLIKGDLNKALDWAMSNDLWGHALYLASRLDKRTYMTALSKFENSLTVSDPIQTLYQFMSQKKPTFITSFIDDKRNEWRKHLAIMISNILQEADIVRDSIISLGDTLMARNNLFAAQFCYLIASADFGTYGQDGVKLVLLGSSHNIPFNEFATNEAIFMTEIYEYVRQLHSHPLKLPHFLPYKFILATRLLEYGLTEKAMLYFEHIGKEIYTNNDPASIDFGLAKNVLMLASQLQYQMAVIAESDDLNWIQKLDNFIVSKQKQQNNQAKIVETEHIESNDKPIMTYTPSTTILHKSDQYEQQNILKNNIQQQEQPIFQQNQQFQQEDQSSQIHFQPYSQPSQFQPEKQHVAQIPEIPNETPFLNFASGTKPMITLPNQNINFDDKPKQDYFDEQMLSDKQELQQDKSNEKHSEKLQSSSNPASSASKFWPFSIMGKILPKPRNQIILPDDSKPSIVYNKETNTWVDLANNNEDGNSNIPLQPPPKAVSLSNLSNYNIPNNMHSNMGNVGSDQNILSNFNNNLPPNPFMNPPSASLNTNNMYKSQNTRGPRKAYLDVLNPQQQKNVPNNTNKNINPISPDNYFNKMNATDPISPINTMNNEPMKVFTPGVNSHSTFLGH